MKAQDKHYQSALEAWRAGKETRAIVTPFAFKLAPELVGMPLARPWRRALAMMLDLTLVAFLSSVPSIWIALMAAIATWVVSKRHEQVVSAWARRWLRIVSSLVIFVVVLELASPLLDDATEDNSDTSPTISQLQQLSHTAAMVIIASKLDDCHHSSCVEQKLPLMKEQLDAVYADKPGTRRELVGSLFDKMAFLSTEQRQQYVAQLMAGVDPQAVDGASASAAASPQASQQASPVSSVTEPSAIVTPTDANDSELNANTLTQAVAPLSSASEMASTTEHNEEQASVQHSIIEWAKGIIADLGLGLSWGALYFTLFTALMRGQTPGKKLLGMRVVRLTGEPLTLWGAFGRYGGYGAGVTTGLLGFLQIYWDNNRQCIQDKIGETVVVMNAELAQLSPATAVSDVVEHSAATNS
ncbi:RDD family protein [Shewanella sp. C32]|uniref:RDD family protein n=1 Tax=Shewanella electrica TaxID=515560 RepID=A0ABT2FQH1_9GAMM|nr:RDD family protein [Shewanella electrica]MCH1926655.1 RDD family protein [Shewanella electrica]MCS4558276.1 RDD family protein [Shewanella electrica]